MAGLGQAASVNQRPLQASTPFPIPSGVTVNARVAKRFHLRLDGNYRAYRTFFNTEQPSQGLSNYVIGNLYNEKFNFSLLPEYRLMLAQGTLIKMPGYVFAGPALSFEVEKIRQTPTLLSIPTRQHFNLTHKEVGVFASASTLNGAASGCSQKSGIHVSTMSTRALSLVSWATSTSLL